MTDYICKTCHDSGKVKRYVKPLGFECEFINCPECCSVEDILKLINILRDNVNTLYDELHALKLRVEKENKV